ncbi:hypothetical protein WJX74_007531 [Apatococcus lobatus]|uniref:Cyclic nucleotide-binding domain-containing protein n=2 Tax=Apatococcus TaxID=904362 RepID=A0AAW1RKM1_9CHLO
MDRTASGAAMVHVEPEFRPGRRGGVSAENSSSLPSTTRLTEKSPEEKERIQKAMQHSIFMTGQHLRLDSEQYDTIVSSMFPVTVTSGQKVIREGQEGDNFYVIEEGVFKATKMVGSARKELFTYEHHGAFGELAMMYNCPRAATVEAQTPGALWAVDRSTFRSIIVDSMIRRREHHEELLSNMPVFSALTAENRAAIADCLVQETYEDQAVILREGDALTSVSKFYLVESGTIECWKVVNGERRMVKTIQQNECFGEVALVTKGAARAADCIAKGKVTVLAMARDAFERLMGPAEEVLSKTVAEYTRLNEQLAQQGSRHPSLTSQAPLLPENGTAEGGSST